MNTTQPSTPTTPRAPTIPLESMQPPAPPRALTPTPTRPISTRPTPACTGPALATPASTGRALATPASTGPGLDSSAPHNAVSTTSIAATPALAPFAPIDPVAMSPVSASPDALAAHLAQSPPTAGPLDTLTHATLTPAGRLDAVIAWERLIRHAHAGLLHSLSRLTHSAARDNWLVETEVCAALAWSPATAQFRLGEADALTRLFPDTLHHLAEGSISIEQARSLTQLTSGLEDPTAQAIEAHVLPRMPGQTAASTRQAIRRAIVRADPDAAAKRHRHERARRRVELRPEDDGMATLSFYLPADIAQMAMRTLTEIAHSAKRKNKTSNDKRTLDQRRADLLPALLHTAATGGALAITASPAIAARVNVVVGIETLLGLSHEPGHLQGYGPICPEQTRRIAHAHTAQWRFLLTATDGTVIDASQRTYTPTAAIKRLTELKRTTCAFPHCAMPAERCDLDHNQPFHKGGPTAVTNLAPLCRRHHNGKSHGQWNLQRHADDTIRWTSNLTGRSYTTTPTRYEPTPTAATATAATPTRN